MGVRYFRMEILPKEILLCGECRKDVGISESDPSEYPNESAFLQVHEYEDGTIDDSVDLVLCEQCFIDRYALMKKRL